jgi:hypothetical protein
MRYLAPPAEMASSSSPQARRCDVQDFFDGPYTLQPAEDLSRVRQSVDTAVEETGSGRENRVRAPANASVPVRGLRPSVFSLAPG